MRRPTTLYNTILFFGGARPPPQRSQHASHAEALHYDETIELEIIGVTNAVP